MKFKGKAKQLFCMACAFVASFLVTVTAFAASTYGIVNPSWLGTYKCSTPSLSGSKIIVHDKYSCRIQAYFDNRSQFRAYFSGETDSYTLEPASSPQFEAIFDKVNQVSSNGTPVTQNGTIVTEPNYTATGKTLDIVKKTINSNQSTLDYVKQNY